MFVSNLFNIVIARSGATWQSPTGRATLRIRDCHATLAMTFNFLFIYYFSDNSTILSSPSVSFQLTTTFCDAMESTSMPV